MSTMPETSVDGVHDLIRNNDINNISPAIAAKVGRNLHLQPHHPLNIIKNKIETYFTSLHHDQNEPKFQVFDSLSPIVTTEQCFDDLLTPKDHVSRQTTDTYYIDQHTILRPHTTAHETDMLRQQIKSFLIAGDVYRRDEIDSSHYPVFHQMEGVRLFPELLGSSSTREERVELIQTHLKQTLEGMIRSIFGQVEMRWIDATFPFTEPSLELEMYYNGDWLEVLGCGVLQQEILRQSNLGEEMGWAFGLGLERLAMVLFQIPDIRLFWSDDPRFLSQFSDDNDRGTVVFQPFSKYPPCLKDISFWHGVDFHENHLCEVVRSVAGDVVEHVELIDAFVHPKTKAQSKCYRITYRHMSRNLTNQEVDSMQAEVRKLLVQQVPEIELR